MTGICSLWGIKVFGYEFVIMFFLLFSIVIS